MLFSAIILSNWRQFFGVDIEFHPRLTVITGANGAGKSTILRVLAQHFGFSYGLLATPLVSSNGVISYYSGLWSSYRSPDEKADIVGKVSYSNQIEAKIVVPAKGGVTYNPRIEGQQRVPGVFISSHRPTSGYQPVNQIRTNAITAEQAYQLYNQEIQTKYQNSYSEFSPTYRIKEAIISMATFGPGNKNVQRNKDIERTYDAFKEMLKIVLPKNIGFRDISIRIPDVVLVTDTGEFVIDGASGGLMSIIDLAWQVFLFSRNHDEFTVVLDEPENHLHPSMQRSILASLLEAFPRVQFIVATHSPFVVSSVRDSAVYVLSHHQSQRRKSSPRTVVSARLDNFSKSGTASDILRDALGVPITLPMWAEDQISAIAHEFSAQQLDQASIGRLRARLAEVGLSEFYPEALGKLAP